MTDTRDLTQQRPWPALSAADDHDTLALLHLVVQMLGKLRVAHAPWTNHGWHVALQPVAQGFETLPTASADGRTFTLILDLCEHVVALRVSDGAHDRVSLELGSVARIHAGLVAMLDRHGLPSRFTTQPSELPDAPRFPDDTAARSYRRDSANRLREAVALIVPVFERFRAGFAGKSSPVHLWWGAFDLAVSRFSGRTAPPHPGGMPGLPDRITREAYSHEVASAGFWAGGATASEPFFYSYIYPEPDGYRTARIAHARFDETFGEHVLSYADVRAAERPSELLLEFLDSAYAAGADLERWDRPALERAPVAP